MLDKIPSFPLPVKVWQGCVFLNLVAEVGAASLLPKGVIGALIIMLFFFGCCTFIRVLIYPR